MASSKNIEIRQGEDFALAVTVKPGGSAVNLTGSTITAKVRSAFDAGSPLATFTVDPTNLAGGQFVLRLTAATTAALAPTPAQPTTRLANLGVYDCQILFAAAAGSLNGRTLRILQGTATLSQRATT